MKKSKKGFTLIEIMCVVAIICIFSAIFLINIGGTVSASKKATEEAEIKSCQIVAMNNDIYHIMQKNSVSIPSGSGADHVTGGNGGNHNGWTNGNNGNGLGGDITGNGNNSGHTPDEITSNNNNNNANQNDANPGNVNSDNNQNGDNQNDVITENNNDNQNTSNNGSSNGSSSSDITNNDNNNSHNNGNGNNSGNNGNGSSSGSQGNHNGTINGNATSTANGAVTITEYADGGKGVRSAVAHGDTVTITIQSDDSNACDITIERTSTGYKLTFPDHWIRYQFDGNLFPRLDCTYQYNLNSSQREYLKNEWGIQCS